MFGLWGRNLARSCQLTLLLLLPVGAPTQVSGNPFGGQSEASSGLIPGVQATLNDTGADMSEPDRAPRPTSPPPSPGGELLELSLRSTLSAPLRLTNVEAIEDVEELKVVARLVLKDFSVRVPSHTVEIRPKASEFSHCIDGRSQQGSCEYVTDIVFTGLAVGGRYSIQVLDVGQNAVIARLAVSAALVEGVNAALPPLALSRVGMNLRLTYRDAPEVVPGARVSLYVLAPLEDEEDVLSLYRQAITNEDGLVQCFTEDDQQAQAMLPPRAPTESVEPCRLWAGGSSLAMNASMVQQLRSVNAGAGENNVEEAYRVLPLTDLVSLEGLETTYSAYEQLQFGHVSILRNPLCLHTVSRQTRVSSSFPSHSCAALSNSLYTRSNTACTWTIQPETRAGTMSLRISDWSLSYNHSLTVSAGDFTKAFIFPSTDRIELGFEHQDKVTIQLHAGGDEQLSVAGEGFCIEYSSLPADRSRVHLSSVVFSSFSITLVVLIMGTLWQKIVRPWYVHRWRLRRGIPNTELAEVQVEEENLPEGANRARHGLSTAAIHALPCKVYCQHLIDEGDLKQSVTCSICIDTVSEGQEVLFLPCGHYFHSHCITHWLRLEGICPNCRQNVIVSAANHGSTGCANSQPSSERNEGTATGSTPTS
eukprot:scaffold6659_cov401-Prasinococcus_capsulatus_cf.AAC.2